MISIIKRDHPTGRKQGIVTMFRMLLATLIAACLTLPAVARTGECDFMALVSQEGTWICDLDDGNEDQYQNYADAGDYFQFLKNNSEDEPGNNDGYGVIYYNKNPWLKASQRFHQVGEDTYYTQGMDPEWQPVWQLEMDFAMVAIIDQCSNQARMVMGHDRAGTGGDGNHPFWFDWKGKTYTFMHNGSIGDPLKAALLDELYYAGWFLDPTHVSNWYGDTTYPINYGTWIDSEVLFHYIMYYVIQKHGRVAESIYEALSQDDLFDEFYVHGYVLNFVLSDGEGLYLFKSSPNYSGYRMSYKFYESGYAEGLVGIKTDSTPAGGQLLTQYEMAHIPVLGNSTEFMGVDGYASSALLFDHHKYHEFTSGNWVCFPILDENSGTLVDDVFEQLTAGGIFGAEVDYIRVETLDGDAVYNAGFGWSHNGVTNIESDQGYKVTLSDGNLSRFYLNADDFTQPEQIDPLTPLQLNNGLNYVPYFLEEPQHPSDAFPQTVLDHMVSIAAENWFMLRINGEFVAVGNCHSGPCYTLNYGDMYEVVMMGIASPPLTFTYNQTTTAGEEFVLSDPEYFSFEPADDYIKVVIESIENGENVIEIGALQNGECVGAEVVEGYPINLRVYADDLSGVTYDVVNEEPLYRRIGDEVENPFGRRTLATAARHEQYGAVFIELADVTGLAITNPTTFSGVTASPNPFNPVTSISFLLNADTDVSLRIYNVRGQLVTTLLQGYLHTGVYNVNWNGTSDNGSPVASGIYYYQLVSNKLILLK